MPPLKARVTDLTNTFDAAQRDALELKLAAFEAAKGGQIAVLIVPTTQPEAIEQYSNRVTEQSKPGRKGVDDGALLLVAKDDRRGSRRWTRLRAPPPRGHPALPADGRAH